MALVRENDTRRIDVHDGWVDIRTALSIGDVLGMANGGGLQALANPTPEVLRGMLTKAIVAWSYSDPVTPENVDRLDLAAATEVLTAVNGQLAGDPKKGESRSDLSPVDAGLTNSPTSD